MSYPCNHGGTSGRALLFAIATAWTCGCDDTSSASSADLFASDVRRVVVEIDYQPGAEPSATPRTLPNGTVLRPLELTRTNLQQLFERTPPIGLVVPLSIEQMERLDDVTASTFDDEAILAIASAHRMPEPRADTRSFYVVFLNGYYVRDGVERTDVLGVTPSDDERVVAIFAPAVASEEAAGFVQQYTLLHELGHVIGLVNDGIPATSTHHDAAHGAHCTNDACVMFHLHEGLEELGPFVMRSITSGPPSLFGPECREDVRAFGH